MEHETPNETSTPPSALGDVPQESLPNAPVEGAAEVRPSGMSKLWREWVLPLSVVILLMISVRSALADWNDVPTGSMKPTILEGDRIYVNKVAYGLRFPAFFPSMRTLWLWRWATPQRGDIVVLFSPANEQRLVKRVVGVPGDRIAVHHNRLSINGTFLQYEPVESGAVVEISDRERAQHEFARETLGAVEHAVMFGRGYSQLDNQDLVIVPPGRYFVMGDNRSHSSDSRVFGFVPEEEIVGRATAVVFSFERNVLHPRWGRFFDRLR